MANIGNNILVAGTDGEAIGGISIANTQVPLPTTIFSNSGAAENIVFNNAASRFRVPQNYTFALLGGLEGSVDATTGAGSFDGSSLQVSVMPDRGFRDSNFPLGFNGAVFQFVGTDIEDQSGGGGTRWPENNGGNFVAMDLRNCTIIGQDVSVYAGITDNRSNAWLFHLGGADTGVAFDRTGTLAADDLEASFRGVALGGVSFAGAMTLQIPADVDYIGVAFPDYNKTVAIQINNLRITAPKGAGVVRTVIKDGSMPFGTGLRAQAADGKVVIIIADASAFVRYQNPSTYAEGVDNTFTENYPQIVTGGVNSGSGGSYWRGYGWKPTITDVVTGLQIEDGYLDFNVLSGDFVVIPSDVNTTVPPIVFSDAANQAAILHGVTNNDNSGYWNITSSVTEAAQENITPNIDTAIVLTPIIPYYMGYLVESSIIPQHVPTGATVESFDETRTQSVQLAADALSGTFTFDTANDNDAGNSNTTQAYAALKRANRDILSGPWGEAVDTSTNGAATFTSTGNLVFSGIANTQIDSNGNATIRVGTGFVGGFNSGATHTVWDFSNIILRNGTTFDSITFRAPVINASTATLNSGVTLGGVVSNLPLIFPGTMENGSQISVDGDTTFNFEGATVEGSVSVVTTTGTATTVTILGDYTGTVTAGPNVTIPPPIVLFTVEPEIIAGSNGFYRLRNLNNGDDVIDVTITNGVPSSTATFDISTLDTIPYRAFYKLDSVLTEQVYRVATQDFVGTSLTRNTTVGPLTVPRPFTDNADGEATGDGGLTVRISYGSSTTDTIIGRWLNATTTLTRPNANQTMSSVILASNTSQYFNWVEVNEFVIDPSDYAQDGATLFNNAVTGIDFFTSTNGIFFNSGEATAQSQISQSAGFNSANVTGVTVAQVLPFDIGNAPLGTVNTAIASQFLVLPTTVQLDALGNQLKQNQQTAVDVFGNATVSKGINIITLPNQP